ncbi:MAG TPA: hypothetical protein VMT17_06255 [Anaeromyxobacteraceae bacterium]|nr:hypothetical protein [Anaeromyxobacteraceae bacterium]
MRRSLLIAAAIAALTVAAERSFRMEEDPIRSLVAADPVAAELFDRYQERSPFRGRIFLEANGLSPSEEEALAATLQGAGYREVPFVSAPDPARVLDLAAQLPAEEVARLAEDAALQQRVADALAVAALPGGGEYLRQLEVDPLGVGPALVTRLARRASGSAGAGAAPRVYQSPHPLVYGRVEKVEAELRALGPRVHWIGADFFALENYQAVHHDILVCTALTLALNLVLFFLFTRRFVLLWLLVVGSVVSYLAGLLAIRAFYPEVFTIVLVYTSTFVSFNTESLVYLSGIEATRRSRALLGVRSAIGTTLLGLAMLLFGRLVLVRQMAIASIAGLLAFLAFLLPYRSTVDAIRFRTFRLRGWVAPPWLLASICGVSVAGLLALGPPEIRTRIDAFRFQTDGLAREAEYFQGKLEAASLGNVAAVPAPAEPSSALRPLASAGLVDWDAHPLARYRDEAAQAATLGMLRDTWPDVRRRVAELAAVGGARLDVSASPPGRRLGEWDYLRALGDIGPVLWMDEVRGARYVHAGLLRGPRGPEERGIVQLGPRPYYDALLTGLSRQLGALFLLGCAAMAVYLAWIQRSVARTLYVFTPLLVVALGFSAWFRWAGSPMTIVHFMGFSLVIAVATDYTSVAISGDHGNVELSKVLLAGLSAIATFAVLALARHPILRSLGATVVAGALPTLVFALLVRLRGEEEGP